MVKGNNDYCGQLHANCLDGAVVFSHPCCGMFVFDVQEFADDDDMM